MDLWVFGFKRCSVLFFCSPSARVSVVVLCKNDGIYHAMIKNVSSSVKPVNIAASAGPVESCMTLQIRPTPKRMRATSHIMMYMYLLLLNAVIR